MKLSEFEDIIEAAVAKIPAKFRKILAKEQIRLIARAKAPPAFRKRGEPTVYGVFFGVSYPDRSVFLQELEPTRIELYKESFEKDCRDRREMEDEIVRTVVHELGHYFGFSENDLARYGLE